MVKLVERWLTADGKTFTTEHEAIKHENYSLGFGAGYHSAIGKLKLWAEMSCGGNLTNEEVRATSLYQNAIMLEKDFGK